LDASHREKTKEDLSSFALRGDMSANFFGMTGFADLQRCERAGIPQCIFFMSCPHAQRGLRTLVASNESFTTSISQQHLEFTQRYLSFFFMAMIRSPVDWKR
jgi:hypothetical protein